MKHKGIALALLGFALVTMGQEGCETATEDAPLEERQQDDGGSSDGGGGDDAVRADPKGDYNLNCDYVLGDFNESGDPAKGFRFLGGGTVSNEGNIGIRVRVTFRWQQLGVSPVVERKTLRVPVGRVREVNVTVPATQDQIDLHQSADGKCSARATIVGRFGKPR